MIKTCEEYVLQRVQELEEERDNLEAEYEALTKRYIKLENAVKAIKPSYDKSAYTPGLMLMTFNGLYDTEDEYKTLLPYAKDMTKELEQEDE